MGYGVAERPRRCARCWRPGRRSRRELFPRRVAFGDLSLGESLRSVELFTRAVMPGAGRGAEGGEVAVRLHTLRRITRHRACDKGTLHRRMPHIMGISMAALSARIAIRLQALRLPAADLIALAAPAHAEDKKVLRVGTLKLSTASRRILRKGSLRPAYTVGGIPSRPDRRHKNAVLTGHVIPGIHASPHS